MCAVLALSAAGLLFLPGEIQSDMHATFVPRLHVGQTLQYKSVARIKRHTKSESRVDTLPQPEDTQDEIAATVEVTIREVRTEGGRPVVAVHVELESPPNGSHAAVAAAGGGAPKPGTAAAPGKLDFTIERDGQISHLAGLDDLGAEQRLAWQFWIAQFAYGWTLPVSGVKPGEKWKSEEAETTPTPIADLSWERETTYVHNDTCPVNPAEMCAVFLTRAKLKQHSADDNATPEAYRLHNLKTMGTAKGTNETITYISLKSHLVLRATEDVQQAMDATVSKADDSNGVHYKMQTNSQFEVVLVPASANSADKR